MNYQQLPFPSGLVVTRQQCVDALLRSNLPCHQPVVVVVEEELLLLLLLLQVMVPVLLVDEAGATMLAVVKPSLAMVRVSEVKSLALD